MRWWPRRRLELLMVPPYDPRSARQEADRRRVEQLITSLEGGLDAGSREVLNNLVNDLTDQAVAQLRLERDDRATHHDILEGMARREVARRQPRYDADLARLRRAETVLAEAFRELTGGELAPPPVRAVVTSPLGPVDLGERRPDEEEQ